MERTLRALRVVSGAGRRPGGAGGDRARQFQQFTVETLPVGTGFDLPVWQISPDGRSVEETKNSWGTFLVSPAPSSNKTIRGYSKVIVQMAQRDSLETWS